jgi:alpha-N-arabinofuranosidase
MRTYLYCAFVVGAVAAIGVRGYAQPSTRAVPLTNGGFEANGVYDGWTLHVYGAQPKLSLDRTVRHGGTQCLRISADAPSDTALGQELQLKPGRWYRLRGWMRVENLDPRAAPVFGTFQIQLPAGRGIIATGRNHRGTQDWVEETIYFTPPDDGLTRIAVFFVGFGRGTGTAWFDDIQLEEIDAIVSTLTITNERLCRGAISPFQYGQFIEYLCAMTPSMFAEKVFDGGFEGVPDYRFEFRKPTDRLEQPWYPDGAVHRGEFALDTANPFNGKVSQRIRQKAGAPCTLAISQGGKSVKAGETLRCTLHLRAEGLANPVSVSLWGAGKTYATAEFNPSDHWQHFEAMLTPTQTDTQATLSVSFRGPGALWIDQVSLMPADNIFGWRRDVAEAIKALKPGIIRFGGSAIEGLEWTATVGNPAQRVPFTTCWGGLEPGNAGVEEFVKLCQWVDAEPLICIRFTGKKPQDAADEVEYFNGPASSPMGKLRVANGHPAPYRVKYWQVGNELGDENYQKGASEFCKAMRAVDPSIKLMSSFPSPGLLRNAGQFFDYICPHHYGCQDLRQMEEDVRRCRQMIADYAPGRDIHLGITEWNTTAGDWGLGRAALWTLDNALACARYHNFMHRNCDVIEIANRSNLADSFCSGIVQTNNSGLFKTPTYYAQQLYAIHSGQYPLKIDIDADVPHDLALDVSATLASDGHRLAVFAVNHTATAQQRTIDLRAFMPLSDDVDVWTLADSATIAERDAANSWREPERIRIEPGRESVRNGKMSHEFPALSLTVLELHRRG